MLSPDTSQTARGLDAGVPKQVAVCCSTVHSAICTQQGESSCPTSFADLQESLSAPTQLHEPQGSQTAQEGRKREQPICTHLSLVVLMIMKSSFRTGQRSKWLGGTPNWWFSMAMFCEGSPSFLRRSGCNRAGSGSQVKECTAFSSVMLAAKLGAAQDWQERAESCMQVQFLWLAGLASEHVPPAAEGQVKEGHLFRPA